MPRSEYVRHPSVPNPRAALLDLVREFVPAAGNCPGVARIALVGSLTTDKPVPKDADLLVTIEEPMDLEPLALVSRRLKGRSLGMNLGADIFLCLGDGRYIGRICRYRQCHARALCEALHCGQRNHLNDDLDNLTLEHSLTVSPPLVLWPKVERHITPPDDVERLLLAPLDRG